MKTIEVNGVVKSRISDLCVEQRVDLEGDLFADPAYHASGDPGDSEHPEFQSEFEVVLEVERETPECTRVDFISGFSCGFPPDYLIDVDGEQTEAELTERRVLESGELS